jgi:hypothetical protein
MLAVQPNMYTYGAGADREQLINCIITYGGGGCSQSLGAEAPSL